MPWLIFAQYTEIIDNFVGFYKKKEPRDTHKLGIVHLIYETGVISIVPFTGQLQRIIVTVWQYKCLWKNKQIKAFILFFSVAFSSISFMGLASLTFIFSTNISLTFTACKQEFIHCKTIINFYKIFSGSHKNFFLRVCFVTCKFEHRWIKVLVFQK